MPLPQYLVRVAVSNSMSPEIHLIYRGCSGKFFFSFPIFITPHAQPLILHMYKYNVAENLSGTYKAIQRKKTPWNRRLSRRDAITWGRLFVTSKTFSFPLRVQYFELPSSKFWIFSGRVGTLGIYSILITNQQQFFVDTIKYCSIPSVPSGFKEVKTRPETRTIIARQKIRNNQAFIMKLV